MKMFDLSLIVLLIFFGSLAVFNYNIQEMCNNSSKNCSGINECCTRHSQCCTQYCSDSGYSPWTIGYCMDPSKVIEIMKLQNEVDSAKSDESNNSDHFTNHIDNVFEEECKPDGYNKCTTNYECCSLFCYDKKISIYGRCINKIEDLDQYYTTPTPKHKSKKKKEKKKDDEEQGSRSENEENYEENNEEDSD